MPIADERFAPPATPLAGRHGPRDPVALGRQAAAGPADPRGGSRQEATPSASSVACHRSAADWSSPASAGAMRP